MGLQKDELETISEKIENELSNAFENYICRYKFIRNTELSESQIDMMKDAFYAGHAKRQTVNEQI